MSLTPYPTLRLKLEPKPTFKLKVMPGFPGGVVGVSPVTVVKHGGNYDIGIDLAALITTIVSQISALVSTAGIKSACLVATTANIALTGLQTIDGVVLLAGDRVLVWQQTSAPANGIYVAAAGAWTRATDADESSEIMSGMLVTVVAGTQFARSVWLLATPAPITLGSTNLTFALLAASPTTT